MINQGMNSINQRSSIAHKLRTAITSLLLGAGFEAIRVRWLRRRFRAGKTSSLLPLS
jgi:hypothetical protein